MALVFVGFMGAGKSSALDDVLDTDKLVEDQLEMPIASFFAAFGEAKFRRREEPIVLRALRSGAPAIALGGGSVLSQTVREALREHTVVWMDISDETAWARAAGDDRPLAADREAFCALHAERRPLYASIADAFLPEGDRLVRRAEPALRALADAPAGTKLVWAVAGGSEYPVFVGRGLIGGLPRPGRRAFVVTDSNVGRAVRRGAARHAPHDHDPGGRAAARRSRSPSACGASSPRRGWAATTISSRSAAGSSAIWRASAPRPTSAACRSCRCRRRSSRRSTRPTAARPASTCRRRRTTSAPTTSRRRSSPTSTRSRRCPREELAAGYAEVVKTALIAGGSLWERVASGAAVDERVVLDCARTKIAVVASDERDGGARQLLNLGHTIGHAIETVTAYRRYRHGEAIALGLLAALRLGGTDDLRAQVLRAAGRRRAADDAWTPDVDPEAVVAATRLDKKRVGNRVPFVLVRAPGDVVFGQRVAAEDVLAAVVELASG